MIRRPPRSTRKESSAASDVYKRQALDHISPDLIDFYPVDAYVNTACPRIAIDDSVRYAKPLITPYELEVALGEKKWETGYQFDEIP